MREKDTGIDYDLAMFATLDFVRGKVKEHTMLLKVTIVMEDNVGQVNVQHVLSDHIYNVYQIERRNGDLVTTYIDNNFRMLVEKYVP